ncbi:ABC transporter ATP-binding protein [Umezawaea sp. Da 62-37]|uniref:ABC transporter ATP-binding protein n=1 Tax=Umezawaea sp. Da 62-37 TaxID=3075927 RepID=UPI0028F72B6E|nr:ABC transporter ATP-binding protein [Umezawaea sp. Da 62-37]WNV84374.1 ABC transporter ATP-binding protein [Umezawaea sp. Da 62-37]
MRAGDPTGRDVLKSAVKGQWRNVTAASIAGAGHQAGEALVPVIIGVVIDRAVSTGVTAELLWWLVALGVVFAVLSFSFRIGLHTGELASERIAHALRVQVTTRVLDHRGGAATGRLAGELVTIATSDATRVGHVGRALPTAVAAGTGLLVGAVALLRVSVVLGLVVLIATPLLLGLAHVLGKPLERRSEAEQERAEHASGIAADLVAGLRSLKGFGAERAAVDRYRGTSQGSMLAAVRSARAQAWLDGSMLAVTGLLLALIALVGGTLAADGSITVGELVAAVGLAQFLLWPLNVISWVNGAFAMGRASAARIAEVLNAPADLAAGTDAVSTPVAGAVRLRGLTHGTLRGLDLDVAAGELLGVVAADPADATALLRCLAREVDPSSGSVELDGVPLSTLDPSGVRAAILVAAHEADLFSDSVVDNIRAVSARPEEVERAMTAAAVHDVVEALPQGADTVVAERGRSLSGGQRQRVALARALAAAPPVLVVHDPTTAIDAVTEMTLAQGIREMRRGRTTIVVTTSPALLATADRIVVLTGGVLTAEGSHADLVRDDDYRATVLA